MTVLDKLYCYDSMYDESVSITEGSITIAAQDATSLSDIYISHSSNTLNHTGSQNITIGTNTGGYNFANPGTISTGIHYPYTTDTISIGNLTYPSHELSVHGDAEVKGKLTVGGVDIGGSLKMIEQRLGILRPNPELESRWERLRELGEEYRKLEQDILGQEEIYNILKK